MNAETQTEQTPAPPSKAETTERDSWLTPGMEAVASRYDARHLRGLWVLLAMAACWGLGFLAGTGRTRLVDWAQAAVGVALVIILVVAMRALRATKAAGLRADQAAVTGEEIAAQIQQPEQAAAMELAEKPAADLERGERCTNPSNHNLPNLRANTRCRWCKRTAGQIVKAYLKGA